eukprot:501457_1
MSLLLLAWLLTHKCKASTSSIHWQYDASGNAASDWPKLYPECGSLHQSPINIIINASTSCTQPLLLDWTYHGQIQHFGIKNNGHSLQAIPFDIVHAAGTDISQIKPLQHPDDTDIRLKNKFYNTYTSTVNSEYCIDSLHFHWASNNEYGSEHEINEKHYPLEAHFVHYSCDYYTGNDALNAYSTSGTTTYDDHNVLAVIGVLFEIGAANPALNKILTTDIIAGVSQYQGANTDLLYYTDFDMNDLLPQNKEMICYLGSLTTPPCFETVRWNVMKHTMTVSQEQMDKFRLILQSTNANNPMAPNWRPLQDINYRKIYECQEDIDIETVVKQQKVNNNNNNNQKQHTIVYNNLNSIEQEENRSRQWSIIAIVCICLVIISIIVITYLSWTVCKERRKIYSMAPSSMISDNIQMIFPESNNSSFKQ